MPGTKTDYGQMFDHELNPRKGWSGDRGMALECSRAVTPGMTNLVYAGCVVHIVNDGTSDKFVLGTEATGDTVTQTFPPLFAFQNENDFDVNPDLGNTAGGVLMALSCLGDFELESTQIAASQTFAVGTYLTSADAAGGLASDGFIKTGTLGTDVICGIVSETGDQADFSFELDSGVNAVRFWTCFFPASLTAA